MNPIIEQYLKLQDLLNLHLQLEEGTYFRTYYQMQHVGSPGMAIKWFVGYYRKQLNQYLKLRNTNLQNRLSPPSEEKCENCIFNQLCVHQDTTNHTWESYHCLDVFIHKDMTAFRFNIGKEFTCHRFQRKEAET